MAPFPLPIKYLDLTMALISPSLLSQLLKLCPNIEKLSLEHCNVPKEVTESMRVFQSSVDTLNLSMCYDLEAEGLAELLRGCEK